MSPVEAAQNRDLGQRLVLDPTLTRREIDRICAELGYSCGPDNSDLSAHWAMPDGRPFVTWTWNPVFRLSVLDVGTVPPQARAALAARLPVLGRDALLAELRRDDPARALMAIWGLVDREEVTALPDLRAVAGSGAEPLASEAARAVQALEEIDTARQELLGGLKLVEGAALDVIAALADSAVARSLLVPPEDCAALFTEDIAGEVAAYLAERPHDLGRGMEGQVPGVEAVTAAQAGLLRWDNALSRAFPMGYRDAAGWLAPGTVWLTWATQTPQGGRITYDGLVLAEGRWQLFPRPYRAIAQVLAARAKSG